MMNIRWRRLESGAGTACSINQRPSSLSDLGDRSEASGKLRADFRGFEVHSGVYVPKKRGNMDHFNAVAAD